MRAGDLLSIGEVAERTGLSVSKIRYYEDCGLITARRSEGGTRRFARSELRRISLIILLQSFGLSLDEIAATMAELPEGKAPNATDWRKLSGKLRDRLDRRIQVLQRTRDMLDTCIGCGCLSLSDCALYNPEDIVGTRGPGAQYVLNGKPSKDPASTQAT